jgi:hypothetical protein
MEGRIWRVEVGPSAPRNPWSHTSSKSPVAEPRVSSASSDKSRRSAEVGVSYLGEVSTENCPLLLLMGKNSISVRASANKIFLMRILRRNS